MKVTSEGVSHVESAIPRPVLQDVCNLVRVSKDEPCVKWEQSTSLQRKWPLIVQRRGLHYALQHTGQIKQKCALTGASLEGFDIDVQLSGLHPTLHGRRLMAIFRKGSPLLAKSL